MQVLRNEIRTGLLVVVTLGLLVTLVLYLGAPGVFKKLNTYHVYIDNAAAMKPGASVLLAGRKVGQVSGLLSPLPLKDRPPGQEKAEVLITLQVAADARIYKQCRARMLSYGLLAELVIDFTNGDENSGLAENGHYFVGERAPDLTELAPKVLDKLDPVITTARETLVELKTAAQNIGEITAKDSQFNQALERFRLFGDNLVTLTNPEGELTKSLHDSMSSLNRSLANVEKITTNFGDGEDLKIALANFKSASVRLDNITEQADRTLGELSPELVSVSRNANQLTDTLKRQPWRIIWPTTKKYADEVIVRPVPSPTPPARLKVKNRGTGRP